MSNNDKVTNTNSSNFAKIITILASFIIIVAGYFFLSTPPVDKKKFEVKEREFSNNVEIGGEFELINTEGKLQNTHDFAGKMRLIYFGFTYCPDICPTALNLISNVINTLDKYRIDVIPIFVTIDPERDTPEVLKPYLEHFHPKIVGFSGSKEQIKQVADLFKVYYAKAPKNDGSAADYLLDHSSFIYLLDGKARFITHFSSSSTPEEIINFIRINKSQK